MSHVILGNDLAAWTAALATAGVVCALLYGVRRHGEADAAQQSGADPVTPGQIQRQAAWPGTDGNQAEKWWAGPFQ